jgi:hypothetical protein
MWSLQSATYTAFVVNKSYPLPLLPEAGAAAAADCALPQVNTYLQNVVSAAGPGEESPTAITSGSSAAEKEVCRGTAA